MRTITITAVALVAALSARATEFDGATRTNDWFDVSMSAVAVGTKIKDNIGITNGQGSWTVVPTVGTATNAVENETKFIALSSDFDEQLTFTPAPFAVTSGYETVVAQIKADAGDELPAFDGNPQAAFTVIVTNSTLQAFGLTDNGWTNLVYSVADLTNVWFTLYMDFAKENSSRYVRYSVKPDNGTLAVLTDSTGESWFQTENKETIESISFTGSGLVKTFSGDELTVPITFGEAAVAFLADYQTATTVVATVSGTVAADTTFTLTVGDHPYTGKYDAGRVTFYGVALTNVFALGSTVGYTLSATDAVNHYTGTAADVPRSTTVGKRTGGWIYEDASNSVSGTWSNSTDQVTLTYSGSPAAAALSDYLFTPTNAVGNAIVTVESQVCFGDVADTSVNPGDDSYAAFRIGDVSGTPTFQVWVKESKNSEPAWVNVSGSGVTPSAEIVYTLTSKFDFIDGTCEFFIGEVQVPLVNENSISKFYLANNIRTMKAIKFNGTGSLVSLTGSYMATEQIAPEVDGTNVTVSSKWVAQNLSDKTVAEARELMSPDNRYPAALTQHGGSSFNYFECYALGIDPAREDKVPEISDPTVDESGKISFSLHGVEAPSGVTLTVTMKSYDSPDGEADVSAVGVEGEMTIVGGGETTNNLKVDPSEVGSVKYYKFDISIGATP